MLNLFRNLTITSSLFINNKLQVKNDFDNICIETFEKSKSLLDFHIADFISELNISEDQKSELKETFHEKMEFTFDTFKFTYNTLTSELFSILSDEVSPIPTDLLRRKILLFRVSIDSIFDDSEIQKNFIQSYVNVMGYNPGSEIKIYIKKVSEEFTKSRIELMKEYDNRMKDLEKEAIKC